MLNPKLLREDINYVADKQSLRGFVLDVELYQKLETQRKQLQQQVENLQATRNSLAKQIGEYKKNKQNADEIIAQASEVSTQTTVKKELLSEVQQQLQSFLERIPNILDDKVPQGTSEEENIVHRTWGEPAEFTFQPLDHIDLCEKKGWLDFDVASQLAAARFSVLKGDLALLHRALAQFMLNLHTQEHHYQEVNTPVIVNNETLYGTGQLPKFEEDLFAVQSGDKEAQSERLFYLIPTAEVTLTNLVAKSIVSVKDLPMRLTAHTCCFRSEAGNSGRDIKGLIRQHQFEKVELVQIVHPDHSWQALEEMTEQAEKVLQLLGLPYRRMVLCSGDIGFCSSFTYDLEVWLPSQEKYREISSISNCLDFQARRMMARCRNEDGEIEFLHTLNGSGVAVGRAMLAVIENYQQEDGSILIPEVLRPYMHGKTSI
jgi:seryl-tRNA synthetase